jgi:hypothetical protein
VPFLRGVARRRLRRPTLGPGRPTPAPARPAWDPSDSDASLSSSRSPGAFGLPVLMMLMLLTVRMPLLLLFRLWRLFLFLRLKLRLMQMKTRRMPNKGTHLSTTGRQSGRALVRLLQQQQQCRRNVHRECALVRAYIHLSYTVVLNVGPLIS